MGEDGDDDPSWWDDEALLMALDVGIDEGGSGDELLVSMQLGKVERARKLKKKWKKRLGAVPFFHSKDYGNYSSGIFRELNRQQREVLLQSLSSYVHLHLSLGLTLRINPSRYETHTTQAFRSQWGNAYSFAIQVLMMATSLFCEAAGLDKEVNVLVESGHRNSAQILQILHEAQKHNDDPRAWLKILTVGLGAKRDHPILQAVDMLAYSEWQHFNEWQCPIYDALHADGSRYIVDVIHADDEIMGAIMRDVHRWLAKRKAFGRRVNRYEEQRGVRRIQQNDAAVAASSAQRDQGQTRRGEGGKKAEA